MCPFAANQQPTPIKRRRKKGSLTSRSRSTPSCCTCGTRGPKWWLSAKWKKAPPSTKYWVKGWVRSIIWKCDSCKRKCSVKLKLYNNFTKVFSWLSDWQCNNWRYKNKNVCFKQVLKEVFTHFVHLFCALLPNKFFLSFKLQFILVHTLLSSSALDLGETASLWADPVQARESTV